MCLFSSEMPIKTTSFVFCYEFDVQWVTNLLVDESRMNFFLVSILLYLNRILATMVNSKKISYCWFLTWFDYKSPTFDSYKCSLVCEVPYKWLMPDKFRLEVLSIGICNEKRYTNTQIVVSRDSMTACDIPKLLFLMRLVKFIITNINFRKE